MNTFDELLRLSDVIYNFLIRFSDFLLSPIVSGSAGFNDFLGLGAIWDTIRLAIGNVFGTDISLFMLVMTVGMGLYIIGTFVGWVLRFIPIL